MLPSVRRRRTRSAFMTGYLRYRRLLGQVYPPRYSNLIKTIYRERSRRIVEVGVDKGYQARLMIETASLNHAASAVEYFGFDLFGGERGEGNVLMRAEFSNRPSLVQQVQSRLRATGAQVRLFQGDTRTTLKPAFAEIGVPDLVFISGRGSAAGVSSDWNAVRAAIGQETIVILDDYHLEAGPELEGVGCETVIDALDPEEYAVEQLRPVDALEETWGTRLVAMVRVRRRQ
jgi:hypothetical protein